MTQHTFSLRFSRGVIFQDGMGSGKYYLAMTNDASAIKKDLYLALLRLRQTVININSASTKKSLRMVSESQWGPVLSYLKK